MHGLSRETGRSQVTRDASKLSVPREYATAAAASVEVLFAQITQLQHCLLAAEGLANLSARGVAEAADVPGKGWLQFNVRSAVAAKSVQRDPASERISFSGEGKERPKIVLQVSICICKYLNLNKLQLYHNTWVIISEQNLECVVIDFVQR